MSGRTRDYETIATRLHELVDQSDDAKQRLTKLVDALWYGLRDSGVSWVGVYLAHFDIRNTHAATELVLGPCRDKPACSPIGLHGVCGQASMSQQTRIVRDVAELGDQYIACDPRDRSEIVVPLIDEGGRCWGVLDLDSWEVGAFDESDDRGLRVVIAATRL